MSSRFLSYLLQWLLCLFVLPLADSQDSSCANCTLPTSYCVNIRQCQPHLDTLVKYGAARHDYLRSLVCGWDEEDPKICCPSIATSEAPSDENIIVKSPVVGTDPICENRTTYPSKCINALECQPVMNLLKKYGDVDGYQDFYNLTCGHDEHSRILVCCPLDNSYLTGQTPWTRLRVPSPDDDAIKHTDDIESIADFKSEQMNASCTDRTVSPSFCRNIWECQVHLNSFEDKVVNQLDKLSCGHDGDNAMVCCPLAFDFNFRALLLGYTPTARPNGPLLSPFCGMNNKHNPPPMVAGRTAEDGTWPWMALLGYKSDSNISEWNCGGSLISSRHVLTAAHCVNQDLTLVRLGDTDLDKSNADIVILQIATATVHPEYNNVTLSNDIAVLKLVEKVHFTRLIRPICLPIPDEIRHDKLTGEQPYVAGWGAMMNHGIGATNLQELQLPVLENEQCQAAYKYARSKVAIDKRVICAGFFEGRKGTCNGDSGGPLMLTSRPGNIFNAFYVIGVTSYSHRCASRGFPEVFTRVTEFLDFITLHLN